MFYKTYKFRLGHRLDLQITSLYELDLFLEQWIKEINKDEGKVLFHLAL